MASVTPVRADSPVPPQLRTPETQRTKQDLPGSATRELGLGPRRSSSLSSGRTDPTMPCAVALAKRSHSQATTTSTFWDQLEGVDEGWTPRTAREAASPSRPSRGSRPLPGESASSVKQQDVTSAWCRGVCCGCVELCATPTQTVLAKGDNSEQDMSPGPVLPPVLCGATCCRHFQTDEPHDLITKETADFCSENKRSEAGTDAHARVHRHGAQGGA